MYAFSIRWHLTRFFYFDTIMYTVLNVDWLTVSEFVVGCGDLYDSTVINFRPPCPRRAGLPFWKQLKQVKQAIAKFKQIMIPWLPSLETRIVVSDKNSSKQTWRRQIYYCPDLERASERLRFLMLGVAAASSWSISVKSRPVRRSWIFFEHCDTKLIIRFEISVKTPKRVRYKNKWRGRPRRQKQHQIHLLHNRGDYVIS